MYWAGFGQEQAFETFTHWCTFVLKVTLENVLQAANAMLKELFARDAILPAFSIQYSFMTDNDFTILEKKLWMQTA